MPRMSAPILAVTSKITLHEATPGTEIHLDEEYGDVVIRQQDGIGIQEDQIVYIALDAVPRVIQFLKECIGDRDDC